MGVKNKYSTYELILISLIALVSIAVKFCLKIIASSLPIGGVVMGSIYMMWVVLITLLIGKTGVATLFSATQALLTLVLGLSGKWGFWVLIGYTIPGIFVDLTFKTKFPTIIKSLVSGALANVIGTIIAMMLFTPKIDNKVFLLIPSLFSGAVGGFFALYIYKFYLSRQQAYITKK